MPTLKPVTPDFLDSAPLRIETDVSVPAPIDACWAMLVDQASWVQWFAELTAVEATPWIWTEPGQTRAVVANGLRVQETAISIDEEREYAFTITKWPLPTAVSVAEGVRLEDRTNGGSPRTQLTYIGAFEPTAIGRRLEDVLRSQLTTAWGRAFTRLGDLANARVKQQRDSETAMGPNDA